jgi:pimeloyl-ACP methyl ester carboxylesterase
VNLLMKDRYDAARRIGKVACPMLFIHGDEDGIVPMRHGKALFEAAMRAERPGGASIEWYAVRGAGHNDVEETGGAEYHQRISEFLESCGIFP